jgi:antirestriction protein
MTALAQKHEITDRPAVYVGTYERYNNGSLYGAWLYLDDYTTEQEFLDACRELHKTESDLELMFQDWENIPEQYIGECWLSPDVWDWIALDDDEREILAAYVDVSGDEGASFPEAMDRYHGQWDSWSDFVDSYVDDTGMLAELPENLRYYFDFERFGRDLAFDFTVTDDGHVFSNH